MNLPLGLFLGIVAGLMLGTFALPQKKINNWQWENYWASFTFFGAFLFPLIIALITVPSFFDVLKDTPGSVLWTVFGFGAAWGLANIGYGISIRILGIAMALALVLGINNAIGTILPIVIYKPEKLLQPEGLWILTGVSIMVIGIILCAKAGKIRAKEQGADDSYGKKKKGSYTAGLIISIASGVLAASFNFALVSGKPIEQIAIASGANPANAANATWVVGLLGGCIVTLFYCAYLWRKNGTMNLFFAKGSSSEWMLTGLMGLLWFGGVMIYGVSVSKLGVLGASLGWPIIQSVSIGSANFFGILTGEFKGAKKSRVILYVALAILLLGIICIGYAGSLSDESL